MGAECSGVQEPYGRVWGLHLNRLNGRRMYLSYFVLVDVLVFVLVDERLIWYSCMFLVMSLLQHLFVSRSRIMFSI